MTSTPPPADPPSADPTGDVPQRTDSAQVEGEAGGELDDVTEVETGDEARGEAGDEAAGEARGEAAPVEEDPFAGGPPPLPTPMLVLDGDLPEEQMAPEAPAEPEDHGNCPRCGGAFDGDGWCTECGERKRDPRDHYTDAPSKNLAGVCDRGLRHSENQDAMAVWSDDDGSAALVACDGVSSATRSAEGAAAAAAAAIESLATDDGSQPAVRVAQAVAGAAAAVAAVGQDFPGSAPSCTIVAALVTGETATVGNVGDSRAYWFPDEGEPRRLTTDDSMATEQIRAGLDPATAEAGPLAHTITRWLGPDSSPGQQEAAITTQRVDEPGWLLVCSDGLWNYASAPNDLAAVLRSAVRAASGAGQPALTMAQWLVTWANERGGADNITVTLLRTPVAAYPPGSVAGSAVQDRDHG